MMRTPILLAVSVALGFGTASAQVLQLDAAPASTALRVNRAQTASGWRLTSLPDGGPVSSLRGDIELTGVTAELKALDFVERHGAMFGVVPAVTLGAPRVMARYTGGGARALRVPQVVAGAELFGHGLTMQFDKSGEFVHAHGIVSEGAAALPPATVLVADAIETALQHLVDQGHSVDDLRAGPKPSLTARVAADGPHLLHSIEVILELGVQPFAVEVDAHDGSVFALRDLAQRGEGTFRFDGGEIPFTTRNGKGTVYKSLKAALKSKASTGKLPEVGGEDVVGGLAEDGFLFGRFAQVIDDLVGKTIADSILQNPKHDWRSGTDDPTGPGDVNDPSAPGQAFDHTNTYYWMTKSALYLTKVFGPLDIDYSVPVIVNANGLINAFYSTGDLGLGHGPGFFAFGDADSKTGDFMDDLSRDPTVASHEFTHGLVGEFGLDFGGNPLDTPPRALNEAVADYFAASFHKTPCVGGQFAAFLGPKVGVMGECLRDISEGRRMPLDLFDVIGGKTGLPEEHEAGVIFGGSLYRIGKALKRKKGDAAIADSLFAFPQSSAEVGFGVVTPENALAAYEAYFAISLWELLDGIAANLPAGLLGKALGAAMELGAVGNIEAGTWWLADLTNGGKLGFKSALLPGITNHAVGFAVKAGQTTTIKLKGLKGTKLDIDLGLAEGNATAPPPTVNAKGTAITWKDIVASEDSILVLTVIPENLAGGSYKALIKVKS